MPIKNVLPVVVMNGLIIKHLWELFKTTRGWDPCGRHTTCCSRAEMVANLYWIPLQIVYGCSHSFFVTLYKQLNKKLLHLRDEIHCRYILYISRHEFIVSTICCHLSCKFVFQLRPSAGIHHPLCFPSYEPFLFIFCWIILSLHESFDKVLHC